MPAPPTQAARPTENRLSKYGPGFEITRKNSFVFKIFSIQRLSAIFPYRMLSIRFVKSIIPRTEANDNCQPASNKPVGLMSSSIIAANDSVLRRLGDRRKKNDMQKTKHIIAALSIGALGGTIIKKIPITIIQIIARPRFIKPATLHNHQIMPAKMPRCSPERLIKCNKPVL